MVEQARNMFCSAMLVVAILADCAATAQSPPGTTGTINTNVFDGVSGRYAEGMKVELLEVKDDAVRLVAVATIDARGRADLVKSHPLAIGHYELRFQLAPELEPTAVAVAPGGRDARLAARAADGESGVALGFHAPAPLTVSVVWGDRSAPQGWVSRRYGEWRPAPIVTASFRAAAPVTDLPPTTVGLAWLVESDDERIQDWVGIVRGRTARSSRGATPPAPARSRRPEKASPSRPRRRGRRRA